ncbi:MAG TPA: hypothetical protein DEA38_06165 [Stenotrophomonas sp.]|nr:hypothetical protein [Stenotrophomonas sp.]
MKRLLAVLPALVQSWGLGMLLVGALAAFTVGVGLGGYGVLAGYVAVAAMAALAYRSRVPLGHDRWNILIPILACCATAVWGFTFSSSQPSDFGVYYRCGVGATSSMVQWLDRCQSAYLADNSTYWLRSYFYSTLVGRIFGEGYSWFKVSNIGLHCATLLLWYFGVRRNLGGRAAALATLLLALYPEYWFTTTLVTTDNAAVLAIAAFLLLIPGLEGKWHVALFSAVAIAAIAFLGNQLRSIGTIFVVALLLWALCRSIAQRRLALLTLPMASIICFFAMTAAFNKANPTGLPDLVEPMRALSSIDFSSDQNFAVNYRWAEHFWTATPESARFANTAYKVSTEFSSGFWDWPGYLFRKSQVVFAGSGYYGLSAFNYPPGNPDSLDNGVLSDIPFDSALFPWLGLVVFAGLSLSVAGVLKTKLEGLPLACLIFVGAFALMVIGAGESQARYSVVIAPALSLLAAMSVFARDNADGPTGNRRRYLVGGAGIVVVYLLVTLVSAVLPSAADVMKGVRLLPAGASATGACQRSDAVLSLDEKRARIDFKDGTTCAVLSIPVRSDATSVGFYVSGSTFPFKFEERPQSPVSYTLYSNGVGIASGSMGRQTVRWVEASLASPHEGVVHLRLNRTAEAGADYVEVSLIRPTVQ